MRCRPCGPYTAFYTLLFVFPAYAYLLLLISGHYRLYLQKVTVISGRRLVSGVDMRHGGTPTVPHAADMQHAQLSPAEISNMTRLIQVKARHTHIYSAIEINYCMKPLSASGIYIQSACNAEGNNAAILITGWERLYSNKTAARTKYKCCLWPGDYDSIREVNVAYKTRFFLFSNRIELFATNFYCPLREPTLHIQRVALAERNRKCPNRTASYLKPFSAPTVRIPGIAICTKVAYQNVDPRFLVEWLEIQRFLGVTKVISYTYKLCQEASDVLKFYSAAGFVDVLPFDYPDKDSVLRVPGDKTYQYFHDEAVTERDCQERTRHYKYAAVMDKDEIVFPGTHARQGALTTFLDKVLEGNTSIAVLRFLTQLHDLDSYTHTTSNTTANISIISGAASRLVTGRVTGCSPAVLDRPKNVYMPERIVAGSVTTHFVKPLSGLKVVDADPGTATVHHYRRRREKFNLYPNLHYHADCSYMQQLGEMVAQATRHVLQELGISIT